MTDYLLRDSCFGCDEIRHEPDTGAAFCTKTRFGDFDCPTIIELRYVSDMAGDWADGIAKARHTDAVTKREAAEQVADALSTWCWALGATFNSAAFLSDCGFGDGSGQLAVLVNPS